MADREKVKNALERCELYGYCTDEKCPYLKYPNCLELLRDDVLSLLKAQEPRMMTLEEAVEHAKLPQFEWSEEAPVYIEYYIKRPSYVKWLIAESLDNWLNDDRKEDYNRAGDFGWRCWTSRPSDSERRNTSWEN